MITTTSALHCLLVLGLLSAGQPGRYINPGRHALQLCDPLHSAEGAVVRGPCPAQGLIPAAAGAVAAWADNRTIIFSSLLRMCVLTAFVARPIEAAAVAALAALPLLLMVLSRSLLRLVPRDKASSGYADYVCITLAHLTT